jgi:hypothetical protein
MNKSPGFQRDLAAMQDEMKNVARIIEATKGGSVSKANELPPQPTPSGASATVPKPRSPRSPRGSSRSEFESPRAPHRSRENVTTRLAPDINQLLTEAALRQKLKRTRPDTRQDIIEAAVVEWLKRHGYDRRRIATDDSKKELPEAALAASEEGSAADQIRASAAEPHAEFPLETLRNINRDNG